MMTYEESREFVAEISKTGSVLGLESICNLMEELGNVQEELSIIHIAGTNGKGSVGAYLDAIFQRAGLTTARYCSPAVFDALEVWKYCGKNITKDEYAKVMSQVKNACDILISKGKPAPTVFEAETAAAFVWFAAKMPDIVLLEAGMGGSTDATNLITKPLASVFVNISRDHMQFLGETVEEIAAVKAGIIKENCPVFSAAQTGSVEDVLRREAKRQNADIIFVDEKNCRQIRETPQKLIFSYKDEQYTTMAGTYQMKNAALAIEVSDYVLSLYGKREEGNLEASDERKAGSPEKKLCIKEGIANAKWPGRFEVLGEEPLFVIDGAHNEDAARELARTVENCFTDTKISFIIGVLADKEHDKMLGIMLPYAKRVFTVTPNHPRALDGNILAAEARKFHDNVTVCHSVEEAVQQARAFKEPVLAFGSLSYLGELKNLWEVIKR